MPSEMTLLAALWQWDGRARPREIRAMLDAQAPAAWRREMLDAARVAMGSAVPIPAAGRPDEAGPLRGGSGTLTMVADVRLDNRDELARSLGVAADAASMSDARLMMTSFERWDTAAIDRFVGDFALILWDDRSQRLVLARDFAGQRPLHFHQSGAIVAVASMAGGLRALEAVPKGIDEGRMLEVLAGLPHEGSHTFFEGIERVQPGEVMTFGGGRRTAGISWSPPSNEIHYKRHDDYAEALLEKLDAAVDARLRDAGSRIAAHLSAGLDSTAVTTSAAARFTGRISAFTSVPPEALPDLPAGRFGNEGPLAARIAAFYPNIDHRLIETGGSLGLEDLERHQRLFERPDLNLPNLVWANKINDAARAEGVEILLVGTMGNSSLSYGGAELVGELLAQGRIGRFLSEYAAMRRRGLPVRALLGPTAKRVLPGAALGAFEHLRRREHHPADTGLFNPHAPGVAEILRRYDRHDQNAYASAPGSRVLTIRRVDPGTYNKGALIGWNLDLRDPTADRRLVEFCLRVPLSEYLRDGTTRALARTALRGRVPEAVRVGPLRGLQSPHWFSMLHADRLEAARRVALIARNPAACRLIDVEKMRRLLEEWPTPGGMAGPAIYRYGFLRGISAGAFIDLYARGGAFCSGAAAHGVDAARRPQ
jgi:asparagine synthase (glutamine-hydrolysing)